MFKTRWTTAMALALFLGVGPIGCAEARRSEVTVERSRGPDGSTTVQRETTVVKDVDPGCSGVLSCTVDFAGEVIAFPFKIVGGLFGAIF
jgi:hypothetical protein